MRGASTFQTPEVSNISGHGFWLFIDDHEVFLPFEEFPWFQNASVAAICRIERPQPDHLYWPELDVDLTVDMIERPGDYPLRARQ